MSDGVMWSYTIIGPRTIEGQEIPTPTSSDLKDGQVLLRVMVGGICGSDLPTFRGKLMDLGTTGMPPKNPHGTALHEVVGEVVASRDDSLPAGAVVVGWATWENAMAEYVVIRGSDLYRFGDALAPSDAIMLQPLACVICAVDALQEIAGKRVAVIGQGSTGILFSHVLKSRGAAHVTGIDCVDRSDVAAVFGVDVMEWTSSDRWAAAAEASSDRADIVVEAIGHQVSTLTDAVTGLAYGGQIFYFGIPDDLFYPFPMERFLRSCGRLYSGVVPLDRRRGYLQKAEEHVLAHPEIIRPYLSRSFKFSEAQDAFDTADVPKPGQLKVVLHI